MAWNIPGNNNGGRDGDRKDGNEPPRNPWPPKRKTGSGGGGRGRGPFDQVTGLLSRLMDNGGPLRWVGLLVVLWLVFNCFVLVGEQERGVVLRFGQFARIMQPGPNFKAPWPIERVQKINTEGVRTFNHQLPVLTRDENIVTVTFNVQYNVSDPRMYLFGTRDADDVLKQVAQSAVREQFGRANLDAALNARGPLTTAAQTALQASLDAYRTGISVTGMSLQDARPPEEVKPAFDEVNSAQQTNERLVNEARAYAAKIVPEARGEAQRTRTQAEGYKTAEIARATGDAQRFTLLVEQYRGAPDVTRTRLWLDAVQQVLANNRKVVGGDGRQLIYVPMTNTGGTGGGTPSAMQPLIQQELTSPTITSTPDNPRPDLPRPTRDGASR